MKVRCEPTIPLIPKMFVDPRSDRSVDQRYRNADRNGAYRGGSNDPKQTSSKTVSPQGLPRLLRSTLGHGAGPATSSSNSTPWLEVIKAPSTRVHLFEKHVRAFCGIALFTGTTLWGETSQGLRETEPRRAHK